MWLLEKRLQCWEARFKRKYQVCLSTGNQLLGKIVFVFWEYLSDYFSIYISCEHIQTPCYVDHVLMF